MAPADDLQETVAHVAVRRLQDRYADIVTRRSWDELADIMHPEVKVTLDLAERALAFQGPEEVAHFVSRQLDHFDFFAFVVLNSVVEIRADMQKAASRLYMQEARQTIATGERSDIFGVYHDVMERSEDRGWLFTERHYRSLARTNPSDEATDMRVLGMNAMDLGELLA
jgi:hypothetical protein